MGHDIKCLTKQHVHCTRTNSIILVVGWMTNPDDSCATNEQLGHQKIYCNADNSLNVIRRCVDVSHERVDSYR